MRLRNGMGCAVFLILSFSQSLNVLAQPWAKKAASAVFTLKTFDKNNQLIGSSNGFFVNNNGEAVSSYVPFKGES